MTYRALFIISLSVNILILLFLVGKRLYYSRTFTPNTRIQEIAVSNNNLYRSIYDCLAVDSTDIVLLGTSITQGFPVELLPGIKNRGISSNATRHLIERAISLQHAKLVFIEAGINDFIVDGLSVEQTFGNYKVLLNMFRGRVVVQSVLPVGGEYLVYKDSVVMLNSKLKRYCAEKSIPYLDIHSIVQHMGPPHSVDGLHPNGCVYKLWAEIINEYLRMQEAED